jgi:hypothetical protein
MHSLAHLSQIACSSQGERLAVLNADDDHWIYVSKAAGTICGFVPKASVRNIETEVGTRGYARERERERRVLLFLHPRFMHAGGWGAVAKSTPLAWLFSLHIYRLKVHCGSYVSALAHTACVRCADDKN